MKVSLFESDYTVIEIFNAPDHYENENNFK